MALNLGDKGRHIVTGFEGIVTARASYLTGCDQVCLQPQGVKDDGQPHTSLWFDEPYVDLVEAGVVRNRTPLRQDGASASPGLRGDFSAPPTR
jgi:hypothetical protein